MESTPTLLELFTNNEFVSLAQISASIELHGLENRVVIADESTYTLEIFGLNKRKIHRLRTEFDWTANDGFMLQTCREFCNYQNANQK